MKIRNLFLFTIITLFFSGCIVYSFYPLYTEKDLFANDILTGNWVSDDDSLWIFEHAYFGKKLPENIDSTSYVLNITKKDQVKSEFAVHIIKLGGHYFLDFYLEEFLNDGDVELADFHIIPVHTFAKLSISDNQLQINWFDQDWLESLLKENKIRIHHEQSEDLILLTAKPKELQKFVSKYANSEEAFKDGLEVILTRE